MSRDYEEKRMEKEHPLTALFLELCVRHRKLEGALEAFFEQCELLLLSAGVNARETRNEVSDETRISKGVPQGETQDGVGARSKLRRDGRLRDAVARRPGRG